MIKKLSKFIGEYKMQTISTPVMVLLESVLDILLPYVMAILIDKGIEKGDMGAVTKYGALLLAAAVLALTFGVGAGRTAAVASTGFAKNVRRGLYNKVQELSFSNIDKFSTASIVTRLTTDVSNVQMAFQMITRIAFRAPSMLVFAMIAAFNLNAELALIYLICIPILGIGMVFLISRVKPIFEIVFKTYDKLNNVVQENLYGVRVVKSYNRQDFETAKFKKTSNKIYENFTKAEKTMAFAMPLMQLCMYGSMVLIYWFGARLIVASGNDAAMGLTTGQLTSLITYAIQILMSLMMISMVFVMLTTSKASGDRIVEILDEEIDIKNPENPIYEVADGSVDFENVHFSYRKAEDDSASEKTEESKESQVVAFKGSIGGAIISLQPERKEVLDDINLHINSGWTVGIIGGTGSSKSSLVQLIPRLYDVTEGAVKVGGVDVREYDMKSLRNQVSMVLQKNVLFTGTIKDNLRWGDENATEEEMIHACKVACAHDFICEFEDGYDTHIEQGGTNVSGGQRQRLCIARALLKKPKILILDDSTSAVDMKTDAMIRKAFADELPETTKIIIAQRIASVQDSDLIIVMDEGKIAATGTHQQLMESSQIYKEVYESQNKGGEDDE